MCKSQAEGGRRCAAHTRENLLAAEAAHAADPSVENQDRLAEARAVHASTDTGNSEIWAQAERLGPDDPDYDRLTHACRRGIELRNAQFEIESQLKWEPKARSTSAAARVQALNAQRGGPINNLSDTTLLRLSRDEDVEVLKAVAGYRGRIPGDIALRLSTHPDAEVRYELARSGGYWDDPVAARQLMDRSDITLRRELAKRASLPNDVMETLSEDPDAQVRAALLFSKPTGHQLSSARGRPRVAVLRALTDRSAKVRLAALNAWHGDGFRRAVDESGQQGVEVWAMPDTDLVERLRNDPNRDVRRRAQDAFAGTEGKWNWHPGMPGGPAGFYREIQ